LQALTTLARLVCNVADCGNEVERYRSVKVDNAKFAEAVWDVPGASQVRRGGKQQVLSDSNGGQAAGFRLFGWLHSPGFSGSGPAPWSASLLWLYRPDVEWVISLLSAMLPQQILFLAGWQRQGGLLSLPANAALGPVQAAASRLRRLADKKGHSGAAISVKADGDGDGGGRPASQFYNTPGFRYQEQVGGLPRGQAQGQT
jgi:hypothetical protein